MTDLKITAGSPHAAELSERLAGNEPLHDVINWYTKLCVCNPDHSKQEYSDLEQAVLNLGLYTESDFSNPDRPAMTAFWGAVKCARIALHALAYEQTESLQQQWRRLND
jgi:hypothetical protein